MIIRLKDPDRTVTLTARQIEALRAAKKRGGAIFISGGRAGGAIRRMCQRMAAMGIVDPRAPWPISTYGEKVLAAIDQSES